jgi:hypothetical protein
LFFKPLPHGDSVEIPLAPFRVLDKDLGVPHTTRQLVPCIEQEEHSARWALKYSKRANIAIVQGGWIAQ